MTNNDTTPLTYNGVSILAYSNTNQPTHCSFTFQVLSIVKGPIDDDGPERFRITLSDGQQFIKGLLAYKSNGIGSKLSKHDVVGLSSYCSVTNSDKALIIFYDMYVKHSGIEGKIGEPECFSLPINSENHQQPDPPSQPFNSVGYYSPPPRCHPSSPGDKSFTLIEDWMVLSSGYILGIVQMPSPPHITIRTSVPLIFAEENSFALDKNANLEAINDYTQFVTTTGSCYELGRKKDTEEFIGSVHNYISNFSNFLDLPDSTIKFGSSVDHVFYGTLIEKFVDKDPNKWVVELDKVEQFRFFGRKIELDAKRYTLSRNTYLSLHPNSRLPSTVGERVAILFCGHVTLDPSADRDLQRPFSAQFFLDFDCTEIGPLAFLTFNESVKAIDFHSKLCPLYEGIMSIFLDDKAPYDLPNRGHTIKKRLLLSGPDNQDNNFGANAKKTRST
jgi:hypothetical protein